MYVLYQLASDERITQTVDRSNHTLGEGFELSQNECVWIIVARLQIKLVHFVTSSTLTLIYLPILDAQRWLLNERDGFVRIELPFLVCALVPS